MNDRAKAILDFWFDDMVVEKRFKRDDNFDQLIREKFKDDHEKATLNEYDDWQDEPLSTLALVILLDQFSRNLYRDDKKAFEFDHKLSRLCRPQAYNRACFVYSPRLRMSTTPRRLPKIGDTSVANCRLGERYPPASRSPGSES